jgi:cell division protein FtsB
MTWMEVVLTLGLSTLFGLPVLGFGLYWTAEFLGLRVERRKQALSAAQAEQLQAELLALRERVAELEQGVSLEERVEFLERLLAEPALPPPPRD